MVYWLLAWWEVILPERSEHGTVSNAEWRVYTKCVEFNERWMQAFTEREHASNYHQRRRQWDEEASQPIKE